MKQKQLTINGAFVSQMKDKMPEKAVIEALLDHGITHYTFCPWDFHTHLRLYAEAKKVVGDKELAKQVSNHFIDVIVNTHCVKKRFTEIPELHRNLKKGAIEEVIAFLYQKIWGMDLGIPPSKMGVKGRTDIVRRLARIPYLDRSRWGESVQKFARSLKPLLVEEREEQGAKGGKGERNPQGEHDLKHYSCEEIDQGLRDYARQTMALAEFKDVVEDFSDELNGAGYGMEGGLGRGQGNPIDADILFYMKLAENYSVPIKKFPLEENGSLHPHSHCPWEIGAPFKMWISGPVLGRLCLALLRPGRSERGRGGERWKALQIA